ncbi:hypothetical protein [Pseudofulvibacter geojedonensis]|uniref:Fumarate hydratase n=1 Tax=Pseudofulvibacter geojedonensis TaxID=1123758 RepID=A0ABW3HYW5_9FLAO
MFEFDQYLGFLAFLTIATMGFWLLIFIATFVVPYWIGGSLVERLKELKEERDARKK